MQAPGLDNPWLLLTALPAIAAAVWLLLATSTPLPAVRRVIGGAGLAAAIAALILIAVSPHWQVQGESRVVWILVDRSLSVGTGTERLLPSVMQDLKNSLGEHDSVGVISFGAEPELLLPPTPARELPDLLTLPERAPSDETWLGPALELAARQSPPGSAAFALVLGDGHDSADKYGGDVARQARAGGLRVFALPVASSPLPEAAISNFTLRLAGNEQRVIAIDVEIYSTVVQSARLEVKVNGEPAKSVSTERMGPDGSLRLGAGRNPVHLRVEPANPASAYVVEVALLAPQNRLPQNDVLKQSLRGTGQARVLVLHGNTGPEPALLRALRRGGTDVVTGPAALLPSEMAEFARYQVLVLSDVPATDFTTTQHQLIERFVRDGGGLCVIGGPNSYAPGGYYETAIEKVMPVTCDVVEKGRKQIPALVVALDRSGSMSAEVGQYTKMELANEGCARTVKLVQNDSLFGMLSVDTRGQWIVPFAPLPDKAAKDAAANTARTNMVGGGGIYTDVALREAAAALRSQEATTRHIVIFADAGDAEVSWMPNSSKRRDWLPLVEEAAKLALEEKITVSTIALGQGDDIPFLRELAEAGQGRFFLVTDAADLPAIFTREAALSAGNFIREDPFRPWHGLGGTMTEGFNFEAAPTPELLGYVATTARPEAQVWLWADKDKERPLLASWRIELGKALAFTSDARDRWADRWLAWDGFDELWQRWIGWLKPDAEVIGGVESEWLSGLQGPGLVLDFFDQQGNPRTLANPAAEIELPDGTIMPVPVLPVGSGSYRVQFPRAGSGTYQARVRERPAGGEERLVARESKVFVPIDELLTRPADTGALKTLAVASRGAIVGSARELADFDPEGATETIRPVQWLLLIAVAGLFAYIGARRFPSVWRREEAARRRAQEERVLSARAAFDRVRSTLQDRSKPLPAASGRQYQAPPPPTPVALPPAPVAPPPAPVAPPPAPSAKPATPAKAADAAESGGLLSAMRKVRKEIGDRHGNNPGGKP